MRSHVHGLATLVTVRHHFFIGSRAFFRIFNGLQFFAIAKLYRALQSHTAELAGGPGHGKQCGFEAAPGHCLRAQSITLTSDHGHQRHINIRTRHKHARCMAHDRGLFYLWSNHDARAVAKRQNRNIKRITQLHKTRAFICSRGVNRSR